MLFRKGQFLAIVALLLASIEPVQAEKPLRRNAEAVSQAFAACSRYLSAWSKQIDPATGLLPQRLDQAVWTPENSAADNFPFMVIAARFLEPQGAAEALFNKAMVGEKLNALQRANLPTEYDLAAGRRVLRTEEQLIFGASEYAKDGLVPMLEILGAGPWSWRMRELVEGIFELAQVESDYGSLPSVNAEVNGEMLQILCRLYWMTGKQCYLDWGRRIGDAYFYEVLPRNYAVPAHFWDFSTHQPAGDKLKLRDHGCEIISGLSLLYAIEVEGESRRSNSYRSPMKRMLDRIIEIGTHESGLHYNSIVAETGELANGRFSDNWGYNYDAYLTYFMASGEEQYRDQVVRVLGNLHQFRNYDWEPRGNKSGADGYADSVEGALGLLRHVPIKGAFDWVETEVRRMLSFQQESGIVEGWWGDGNFCRTVLMYALFHTKGVYCLPWRDNLKIASEFTDGGIRILLEAGSSWRGELRFDPPRHAYFLGMEEDYPRINAFPEWFTVGPLGVYQVIGLNPAPLVILGQELIDGLAIELTPEQSLLLQVRPLGRNLDNL